LIHIKNINKGFVTAKIIKKIKGQQKRLTHYESAFDNIT